MKTSIHHVLGSAPSCKPIRADLRNSTVTFDWPANVLVRKADYIIVPADEAQSALKHIDRCAIHVDQKQHRPPYVNWDCDRSRYTAFRDGRTFNVYFEYPGEERAFPIPSTWWGRVYVDDVDGVTWDASLGRMVMDDFGNLVPVGA